MEEAGSCMVGWAGMTTQQKVGASILVSIADNQVSPQAFQFLTPNTLDADDFSCSFSAAYLLRAFKFKRCRTKVAIKVVLFMSHRLLYFLIAHMCLWAEFLHAASSRRIWSFNCIPCTRMAWAQGQHVCLEEGDFFTQNSCFSVLYPET